MKRFSLNRASFYNSRKIQELIEFPVEGLDLSEHLIGNHSSENRKLVYDLYAVSNHFGNMNGGHYTAYAKNPINNKWYEFDDSHVTPLDPRKVVDKSAYVLFYKRR